MSTLTDLDQADFQAHVQEFYWCAGNAGRN